MKSVFHPMRFWLVTVAIAPIAAASGTVPAVAQTARVSLPPLPLAEALGRITAATGAKIVADPDAVSSVVSAPVDAAGALAAVRQATAGSSLVVRADGGTIYVTSDILIIARRDEAEDNVLVRGSTTSSRTGQSLRDQPRNTQVISSKLIAEQQSQTIVDALRNAGGVSVNTAALQGGTTYTVRGFASAGLVNGMPGAAANAGTTQPIANIERVEILKGPDAVLSGQGNLGGAINLVTKKPSAETLLSVTAEAGSFGQLRLTGDANRAINDDRTLSARVIGAVSTADRNYGGYRGSKDFLFAPSLRFKNASTDVILSASVGEQSSGPTPFVPLNPSTGQLFDVPDGKLVLGIKDQGIQIRTSQFNGEVTQRVTDWLTLVARAQHQKLRVAISQYIPFATLGSDGTLLLSNEPSLQTANSDAVDGFARINVDTGPVKHTLVAGYTYSNSQTTTFSGSKTDFFPYNFLTAEGPPSVPLVPIDTRNYLQTGTQSGWYAQYLAKVWKISLTAGVRRNHAESAIKFYTRNQNGLDQATATTPNFGAVVDITDNVSVFGSLAYGYAPTFALGRDGQKLPDIKTRNAEAGVKIELFGDRVLVNASYFKLRQSNLLITDPVSPRFQIAVPGQLGTGIDLNISGEIVRGWTVQGSYTRTKYKYLTPTQFGNVIIGQPRDQYSLYTSYRRPLGGDVSGGLGAGVFGRSSASVDRLGTYAVPASLQVDLNGFLKLGKLDANLGVRNVFDRRNYNITYASTYIPIAEPRNVRLTLGYRFQ